MYIYIYIYIYIHVIISNGFHIAIDVADHPRYGGRFMRAMSTYFVKDCAEVSEEAAEDGRQ